MFLLSIFIKLFINCYYVFSHVSVSFLLNSFGQTNFSLISFFCFDLNCCAEWVDFVVCFVGSFLIRLFVGCTALVCLFCCFSKFFMLVASLVACLYIVLVYRLFSASWFGFSIRFPIGKRFPFRCIRTLGLNFSSHWNLTSILQTISHMNIPFLFEVTLVKILECSSKPIVPFPHLLHFGTILLTSTPHLGPC